MLFSLIGCDDQGDKGSKDSPQVTGKDSYMDLSDSLWENKYWILWVFFCLVCLSVEYIHELSFRCSVIYSNIYIVSILHNKVYIHRWMIISGSCETAQ